jgi:hypothetical protein
MGNNKQYNYIAEGGLGSSSYQPSNSGSSYQLSSSGFNKRTPKPSAVHLFSGPGFFKIGFSYIG